MNLVLSAAVAVCAMVAGVLLAHLFGAAKKKKTTPAGNTPDRAVPTGEKQLIAALEWMNFMRYDGDVLPRPEEMAKAAEYTPPRSAGQLPK